MRKCFEFFVFFFLILFCSGCFVMENPYSGIAPGPWRAVLKLEYVPITPNPKGEPIPEKVNLKFEEVSQGELPFVFEVIYENENDFYIEIINGEERIEVRDIIFGRDNETGKDTLYANFPVFDSYIRAICEESIIEGEWVVNNRLSYSIPFLARQGRNHRFTPLRKTPIMDISGKWEVEFEDEDGPFAAIGEFVQNGNHLTGTFLTETGDYRFLEGSVQANKVYLSTFDGAHAFLFEAKILEDSSMIGSFRSGKHYIATWEAKRNPNANLKDPYELTYLKDGYDQFDFAFKNPEGQLIQLTDEAYEGKAKIIQILGTWCPNCRDETNFLMAYLQENKHPDLAVISLAFERYRDEDKAMAALTKYKTHFGFDHEILLAGYYSKDEASAALPMLNRIISYPTLLFLDRENQVQKIHTGFNGPATSKFESFKKEFESDITLLIEKKPS